MSPGRIESWLLALADPQGPRPTLPAARLRAFQLRRLFDLADRHGVLPAVAANLNRVIRERSRERIFVPSASHNSNRVIPQSLMDEVHSRLFRRTAFCLMLRKHLERIEAALIENSIPTVVLKGPLFADRLYPEPGLRPFADIDLLVPAEVFADAARLLESLEFIAEPYAARKAGDDYGERTWRIPGEGSGAVEIHWNLVNCPSQRRRTSVAFQDLQIDPAEGKRLPQPSASSLLLIAAVHGALSHRFDRLQLLCDICQAARGVAGEIDVAWLIRTAERTGSFAALAAALSLSEGALREKACGRLLRRLRGGKSLRIPRGILTPLTVVRSRSRLSTLRRQLFRELMKRI